MVKLKAIPSPAPYITATTMRTMLGRQRYDSDHDAGLVRRASGYVFRCAEINADRQAAIPMCLYRKARPSTQRLSKSEAIKRAMQSKYPVWALADLLPGRPVSKARMERMLGANSVEVRRKVAAMTGDMEEVPAHPILDLLANPNTDESGYDLDWLCNMFMEVCGRAAWLKISNGGMPTQLRTLMPQYLNAIYSDPGGETLFKGFEYGTGVGEKMTLATEDVVYFRKPDVTDIAGGMGSLEAGLHVSDVEQAVRQAQWQMLQMGSMIQYAVKTAGTLSEESQKSLETSWRRRWSGVRNWFRSLIILDQGMDLVRLNDPPKDMGMSDALKDVIRDVCIQFGVPQSMLTTEGGNRLGETSNAQQGSSDYVENTLIPRLRRKEAVLNGQLLPDFGDGYTLAYVLPHSEDEQGKAEVSAVWVNSGIKTINEVRGELELAPVEGGDVLRVNGTALERLDAPPAAPTFGFGGGPRAGGDEKPPAPDDAAEAEDEVEPEPEAEPAEKAIKSAGVGCCGHTKSMRQSEAWLAKAADPEPGDPFTPTEFPDIAVLAERLGSVIDEMWAQAREGVASLPGGKAERPVSTEVDRIMREAGYNADAWVERMLDELERGVREFIEAGAKVGRMALKDDAVGVAFDLANPKVAEFLDGYRLQFREAAQSSVASVETDVRRALQEGLRAGDSTTALEARLTEAHATLAPYRAELLARTESARAYGAGAESAWVSSPNVVGKRWVLAPRACPACEAVAKQFNQAKIGEPFVRKGTTLALEGGGTFVVDFSDVTAPPLHPNDRCTIVPVLSGET